MYKIKFSDDALKTFRKMESVIQKRITDYLDREALLKAPKLFGEALLYNHKGNWRYRIGDYRIICRIEEKELIILVLDVGHRKNIY